MHILFLTDNFPPEVNAPASRTFEHCREWVTAGHRVTVITGAPNFPEGRLMAGYRNGLRPQRETIAGVEVVRVWTYITANQGFARRILDYLSFAVAAFLAGVARPCDVIVATSPQFFTSWAGWALAGIKRRPWVFEVRDLWPESIVAVGAMKAGRVLRWLERVELGLYRSAVRVVVVTEAFRDNLIKRGIDPAKIAVVTNGVDLARFAARPRDTALADELGLAGKTIISYLGTHGAAHGLDFIVDCAARVDNPKVHFLFVGAGAAKADAVARAAALGLSNVTFRDPVPKSEIARYIAASDVILVPLRRAELFTTVIPSKIFEAAAMERPILLGVEGEARGIVEGHQAGLAFIPEDQASFLEQLAAILRDPGRFIPGCRRLAAAYDRRALAQTMLTELETATHHQ